MTRGRKADKGTYEAREKISLICNKILMIKDLSNDAQERVIKALKFGLGVKDEEKIINVIEKSNTEEKEVATSIKEKNTEKDNLSHPEGDVYFKSEDCKEVGY
jgi:hypothetical protein